MGSSIGGNGWYNSYSASRGLSSSRPTSVDNSDTSSGASGTSGTEMCGLPSSASGIMDAMQESAEWSAYREAHAKWQAKFDACYNKALAAALFARDSIETCTTIMGHPPDYFWNQVEELKKEEPQKPKQ